MWMVMLVMARVVVILWAVLVDTVMTATIEVATHLRFWLWLCVAVLEGGGGAGNGPTMLRECTYVCTHVGRTGFNGTANGREWWM